MVLIRVVSNLEVIVLIIEFKTLVYHFDPFPESYPVFNGFGTFKGLGIIPNGVVVCGAI
jgi:hypothetical protein